MKAKQIKQEHTFNCVVYMWLLYSLLIFKKTNELKKNLLDLLGRYSTKKNLFCDYITSRSVKMKGKQNKIRKKLKLKFMFFVFASPIRKQIFLFSRRLF